MPLVYVQLDLCRTPDRTFHSLIHIGILPKNVSGVTGWNSQMAGQSDKHDAAREEFILEPLPASFFGTGAEMIALGVSAARKKRSDILVGGILGSFAYNLLVTLGLAAAIHSIPVDSQVTFITLPVMVVIHLVLLALIWYGKISRVMGVLLMGVYVAYLIGVVLA